MKDWLAANFQTIGIAGIMALGLVVMHDLATQALGLYAVWLSSCP